MMPLNYRTLNYRRVIHRDGVTFIPLPRALWEMNDVPRCACRYCAALPADDPTRGAWDTLAVSEATVYAWTVHMPEARDD